MKNTRFISKIRLSKITLYILFNLVYFLNSFKYQKRAYSVVYKNKRVDDDCFNFGDCFGFVYRRNS